MLLFPVYNIQSSQSETSESHSLQQHQAGYISGDTFQGSECQ